MLGYLLFITWTCKGTNFVRRNKTCLNKDSRLWHEIVTTSRRISRKDGNSKTNLSEIMTKTAHITMGVHYREKARRCISEGGCQFPSTVTIWNAPCKVVNVANCMAVKESTSQSMKDGVRCGDRIKGPKLRLVYCGSYIYEGSNSRRASSQLLQLVYFSHSSYIYKRGKVTCWLLECGSSTAAPPQLAR